MPINPAIQRFVADARNWRRDIHQHPELLYDVPRTAVLRRRSAEGVRLRRSGDRHRPDRRRRGHPRARRGAARRPSACAPTWTRCRSTRRPICRIDRPIPARCTPAATTAIPRCCSAPRAISRESRNFAGTAVVIFQPAEEGGGGAKAMLDDGLMERFGVQQVYGMHNMPQTAGRRLRDPQRPVARRGRPLHHQYRRARRPRRPAPSSASIRSSPGAQIVSALQSDRRAQRRPARFLRRFGDRFEAGTTVQRHPADRRSCSARRAQLAAPTTRDLVERRLIEIAKGVGAAHGRAGRRRI